MLLPAAHAGRCRRDHAGHDTPVQQTLAETTAREQAAEQALRDGLRLEPTATHAAGRAHHGAGTAKAPKVDSTNPADEIAEIDKSLKAIEQEIMAEDRLANADRQGRRAEAPESSRLIEEANAEAKLGEADAKAYEAAALCAIGRA